ncbi:MAG: FAD-dependent oxidoreductase [Pseudomonadota bacterium]|nr:FAD-dependent oxidoreductase [Pseudomonadota bacterium]
MPSNKDIIIIGAGHSAGQAIISLKQKKYSGKITVIGDEPWYPYQKPPLSKTFLSGDIVRERLYLKPAQYFDDTNIDFQFNTHAERIIPEKNIVQTKDCDLSFGKLIISTGARPRKINVNGATLRKIFYLRKIDDAENIKSSLKKNKSIVIIGAGYIGLEVAAIAIKFGMNVTVIEAQDRVMNRVVSREISDFYEREHKKHGVKFIFNKEVTSFEGDKNVEQVVLSDQKCIKTDVVLIGIGAIPNTEIANHTKIKIDDGIVVDNKCCTEEKDIYAIGDCTSHWSNIFNKNIRLESVQNALDQAKIAVDNVCGINSIYDTVPWFWSDQYKLKLQIAGISEGYDETIIRGDKEKKSFSCLYLKNKILIAIDAINNPKDFIQSKKIIAEKIPMNLDKLTDPKIELKDLT